MNTRLLEDKVVVVTGGSRGIGRAIAIEAARHGAHVVINYLRRVDASVGRDEAADEVVSAIEALDRRALLVEANIGLRSSAHRVVEATVEAFGHVDVLAANAGICPFAPFLDVTPEMFLSTMEVNLHGAFFATQAVGEQMKRQGTGGAIVATSSISALVGGGQQAHYTPSKAGIHSLMQSAAIALAPYGVRCNSVMPGTIATDINKENLSDPKKLADMRNRIPLGRLGTPEEVASVVVFLASDMARYVTGAALLVDGGLFANLQ
jgi:L-rhamnose 1-dehydrogenase